MSMLITTIGESTRNFEQSFLQRIVIGVHQDRIYATSSGTLQFSIDGGKTWQNTNLTVVGDSFNLVHTTQIGIILAFTSNRPSRLFRSTDGGTSWTEPIVDSGGWIQPFPQGVGSNGNTIIMGEWTLSDFPYSRLFKSTDGGQTWTVLMSLAQPSEVRHWHTSQYLGEGIWLATTGDYSEGHHYLDNGENQVHWYISYDNGATFSEVEGVDQRHRTLYAHLLGGTDLMWSADGVPGEQYGAIYKAPLSNPLEVEVVFHLGKTSWGLAGGSGRYIAVTSLEPGDTDNLTNAYSSIDGGKTWQLESYHRAKEGDNFVGYRFPMGPDNDGNIYVQTSSLGYVPSGDNGGWRATTAFKAF